MWTFPLFWCGKLAPEVFPRILGTLNIQHRKSSRTNSFLGNISVTTRRREYIKKNLFVERISMTISSIMQSWILNCADLTFRLTTRELSVVTKRLILAPYLFVRWFLKRHEDRFGSHDTVQFDIYRLNMLTDTERDNAKSDLINSS
jgi:hypothetical protein